MTRVLILIVVMCVPVAAQDLHEWQSTASSTIEAQFHSIDLNQKVVTLLVPKIVRFDQLAPSSLDKAKELAKSQALESEPVLGRKRPTNLKEAGLLTIGDYEKIETVSDRLSATLLVATAAAFRDSEDAVSVLTIHDAMHMSEVFDTLIEKKMLGDTVLLVNVATVYVNGIKLSRREVIEGLGQQSGMESVAMFVSMWKLQQTQDN